MKYSHSSQHRKTCPHDPDHRAQLGFRLRSARCTLGWSALDAAKNLQVTERTWHNWENGSHRIPYAVYKLLRVLARLELPGAAWAGWSLQGGNLVTPENHVITPKDGAWWSLMVRKANGFLASYHEANRLRLMLQGHGIDPTDGTQTTTAALHAGGRAAATCGHAVAVGSAGHEANRHRPVDPPSCNTGGKHPLNNIKLTSNGIQNDVIMTSWPILYDSPPPLTHLPESVQTSSASALTGSCALPWTPTCELRATLQRPASGPHLSEQPRPPSRPPSRPPNRPKPAQTSPSKLTCPPVGSGQDSSPKMQPSSSKQGNKARGGSPKSDVKVTSPLPLPPGKGFAVSKGLRGKAVSLTADSGVQS